MSGDGGIPATALDDRSLARLVEVGRSLVSELDLDTVLNHVLEAARDLTGARYAALGILGSDGRLERFLYVGIDEETRRAIGDLPRGLGVLGLVVDRAEPLRLADVGAHPLSYGFPSGHPPMRSFLGVPITIRGAAYGNLYLTEKAGGEFDEADERATTILADWASIAIENARLYSDVRDRRSELERTLRAFEATVEISRAIGGETHLERVLDTVAKRARALVDARALVVLLESGDRLELVAGAGEFDRDAIGARLAPDSAWYPVLRRAKSERVGDADSRVGISPQELGVSASTALLVPLLFRERPLGLLAAFDRLVDGPGFDPEDERLLVAFAASAATAVATAQSVAQDQLQQSIEASERERGRWARELHDETLQGIGAARLTLGSGLRQGSPAELRKAVATAMDQLATEIQNLRALISELRPPALDQLGLAAALEALVRHYTAVTGIDVETEIELEPRSEERETLDRERESALYRIAQEALTNVAKHADAEHVRVALSEGEAQLELAIADDGGGFDPEARHEGFGLVGMSERISLVGGNLEISSRPRTGTVVRAVLPLRRSARSAAARQSA